MSYFDKFMKDLEQRREKQIARAKEMAQSEEAHGMRERVRRYSERWQNSIRYGGRNDNSKKTR